MRGMERQLPTVFENELASLGWSRKEIEALKQGLEDGVRPIAPSLADQMYSLFQAGYSAQEIADRNPPFELKDILYLRWKRQWDTRLLEHFSDLMKRVRQKNALVKMESVDYLLNYLSVTHKKYGEQMIRYLQTGREEDLPEMPSLKIYKEIIEILQKITGEDRKIQIQGDIHHVHKGAKADEEVSQSEFLAWLAAAEGKTET